MIDRRDPTAMGEVLLGQRVVVLALGHLVRAGHHFRHTFRHSDPVPLSAVIDNPVTQQRLAAVAHYRDETTIEKYGDPRLLPSTMP